MTEDFKRKLTAILSADVVGYSRLMGEDEEATVLTLNKYKEIIFNLIEKNNGRLVDSVGDNVLAEFISVVDAVRCGVQIQEDLKVSNEELPPDRKMEFRIGIHTGDVIQDGDRIYGDGVNVAARIESLADPGGICVSSIAYEQVKKKLNYEYEHLGEYEVKNIDEPVSVYKVLMVSKPTDKVVEERKVDIETSLIRNVAIILIIIIAGLFIWRFYPSQRIKTESDSVETEQIPVTKEVKEAPKTIAVLPFDDYSPEGDQEHFVLGLSEEILNSLTQIPDLTVTAKTSSFYFKDKNKTFQEIANALGVEHILEGSVRKDRNNLRITAQLIKAVDESHIWSETYNRELKDIFKIQEDIANNVADKLKLTLEAFKLLGGTKNVEAYELYLTAKGVREGPGPEGPDHLAQLLQQDIELLNDATTLDPEFALAWALKGMIHISRSGKVSSGHGSLEFDEGLQAVFKAIELEPRLGKAYLSLGTAHMLKGEFVEAEKAYRKGLDLGINSLDYFDYGLIWHYMSVCHLRQSQALLEEIIRNDPMHIALRAAYLLNLGYLSGLDQAKEEYKRITEVHKDQWFIDLYLILFQPGDKENLSINDIPVNKEFREGLGILNVNIESPGKALEELKKLYSTNNNLLSFELLHIAVFAVYLGDNEFALDAMERAFKYDYGTLCYIWAQLFKEVRQLPRFKEIMREIGLVDYWKEYGWPDLCSPVGDDDFVCK